MLLIALKILIGDKSKFIGIALGLSFATLILAQQSAIFAGLMARTFSFISDTNQNDIWVMEKGVRMVDDVKPLRDTQLLVVKGIEGVAWASPLYKRQVSVRLSDGSLQTSYLIGIDGATLIGGPPSMVEGKIADLRLIDGIIVSEAGATGLLAKGRGEAPLRVGESVEINDHRAQVVGICKSARTFQSFPIIYTTYNRALAFAPKERKQLSFILVKAKKGVSLEELCKRISSKSGLAAYTSAQFKWLTCRFFLEETGIPINFGITVLLGVIIGLAISGQTFYNFIIDNLRYFAIFKAMGANNSLITKMVLLQALFVATIGFGIGIGSAAALGFLGLIKALAFILMWQIYVGSFILILLITTLSARINIRRLYRADPAIIFQGQGR